MLISDGGNDSEMLIVHTDSMLQTGKGIEDNAMNLGDNLTKCMYDFRGGYSSYVLPSCLQNTFHSYATAHTTELDKMVKRRHTIGDLLTKAADLHELNETMQKRGFANLYQNINGYYSSNMDNSDLINMQRGISTQK